MALTAQLAKHFRDIHFGGNWTFSNLKDNLSDVTWQEAVTKIDSFNTIAALTYHISYFVSAVIPVFQGQHLDAHDKFSFDHPPINNQDDWDTILKKSWANAETLATLIEQLPEQTLWENFTDAKYGNYLRNILGIIEHSHYHLGQIVILKKLVRQASN